jgi:hypothetical protein
MTMISYGIPSYPFFHKKKELTIAWIDDRCRKLVGLKFHPDNTGIDTADARREVFSIYPPRFTISTDNGTEFKGDFDSMLAQSGTAHARPTPLVLSRTASINAAG